MTTVVVNDASCLIDLRKGGLVRAMLTLPYRFVVPLPIRRSEALDFTDEDWQRMDADGLETFDLPPEQVAAAMRVRVAHPKLSANDCICLVSARCYEQGVLLTGDRLLHRAAAEVGLCVHGVLWIVEELRKAGSCDHAVLISALECWRDDPTVFLPRQVVDARLRGLRREVQRGG